MGLQLPVDGIMGSETRSALRRFQAQEKLPVTGIVGPDTERALLAATARTSPSKPEERESFDTEAIDLEWETGGDRRSPEYIRWVQQSLNHIMGLRLKVDGSLGSQTRSAIRRFQQQRGLRVDGAVGSQTEQALVTAGASPPPSSRLAPQPRTPAGPPSPPAVDVARGCPEPARIATDRCLNPGTQTCPAIPDLLCVRETGGIPFEYPTSIQRTSAAGLFTVVKRIPNRIQRFIPSVQGALVRFVADMRRFGMPVEAMLTAGSLYCRCVSKSNTLSNHSFGDAIDIVGVRWPSMGGPASRLRETVVHNYADPAERALLIRINACLRLSFATVIDYHRADHRDHFHCDMHRGAGGRSVVSQPWPSSKKP